MKWFRTKKRGQAPVFERTSSTAGTGLTQRQVDIRTEAGAVNVQKQGQTTSVPRIVLKNCLTLFNLINLFLAVILIWVGHPENTLFFGIVICNTGMGIFQEVRAKRTLDKLSLLAQAKVQVVRDGGERSIPQDCLVLDDIVLLASGDQVCADGDVVESAGLELDESLLTGETDRIHKDAGDTVLSGSYVTGGRGAVRITAVGEDNYANSLTAQVQRSKRHKSRLLRVLNLIILVLTIVIIPLGLLLFYSGYSQGEPIQSAVLGAAAAMTGMIPGGLVLLTGVTLTVGAMNLARRKALVQSLPSIETLARVDVLCLDKTGTITDGALVFEQLAVQPGAEEHAVRAALAALMGALKDTNTTARCLRSVFGESHSWLATAAVPFSSDRKWSGASFEEAGSYVLGAPHILFEEGEPFLFQADRWADEGYRVLCLAHSPHPIQGTTLPDGLTCQSLLLLSDSVRRDAPDTFAYFIGEGIALKVISGDNPHTAAAVAAKAGLVDTNRSVDMRKVKEDADYGAIAAENTVFGHVTPQQKQLLVKAMQGEGHTVCMTGDGVNDILAMREADCSVAMVGGSSAARSACDFVLLSASFSAMTNVLREGRRVINNIERVAALYLVNTVFSVILSLIYTLLPLPYPYAPLQMTPINALTVGIPSFFLALQANYARPQGKLMSNIFEHAFPAALTIVFNTLYLQLACILFELPAEELSTMVVFMVGIVGFYLLLRIAGPFTKSVKILLGTMAAGFVLLFTVGGSIFQYVSLFTRNAFFWLPLLYFSFHIHVFLGKASHQLIESLKKLKEKGLKDF